MPRPVLFVLAGVNGAGKSSIGGHALLAAGLDWFNPDAFARELIAATGCDAQTANAEAWSEGMRRLDRALASNRSHAFETTLGGRTVASKLLAAARTHNLHVMYFGLASPEQHIARVRARVAAGGHDIPEALTRARFESAQLNLLRLMPVLTRLQIYDNSAEADEDGVIPDPVLVLDYHDGRIRHPDPNDASSLKSTPHWARAIVEAALSRSAAVVDAS
ncbi:MAG: hypothetical protein AVDCRST_MAG71-3079 [uncultured Lysobacter sp.]|uniref:UDP-N-acetylglucosamine kinase n=1 Tax=uncultured Lysobacter sp. TaxID=271060 RepID=A0A6J4MEY8_9GAMM|nr:MAG: hypothetical protein AVDCRST_MAG71-3079 [uncultured Lysobacter sp.]